MRAAALSRLRHPLLFDYLRQALEQHAACEIELEEERSLDISGQCRAPDDLHKLLLMLLTCYCERTDSCYKKTAVTASLQAIAYLGKAPICRLYSANTVEPVLALSPCYLQNSTLVTGKHDSGWALFIGLMCDRTLSGYLPQRM